MATTTPNYGWPVPTSTDYVKDGAVAIEALGDAIDATVFGLPTAGLTLIKSQVIGSAVSSVNVTAAFSTTYDYYKVIVSGGVATGAALSFRVGSPGTGFYGAYVYSNNFGATPAAIGTSNAANWASVGWGNSSGIMFEAEVYSPFLAKDTYCKSAAIDTANSRFGAFTGWLNTTTSFTDFTITPASGTLTGGTIFVYGYKK